MQGTCDIIISLADEPKLVINTALFLIQDGVAGTELVIFSCCWLLKKACVVPLVRLHMHGTCVEPVTANPLLYGLRIGMAWLPSLPVSHPRHHISRTILDVYLSLH